jgi:hypothetical protein
MASIMTKLHKAWVGCGAFCATIALLHTAVRARGPEFTPVQTGQPIPKFAFTGMADCDRSNCHSRQKYKELDAAYDERATRIGRDESLTWLTKNLHSKAYEVLTKPVSKQIAANLAKRTGKFVPAHEDIRCLACHSIPEVALNANRVLGKSRTPAPDPKFAAVVLRDGVSCEGCHGPSSVWTEPHKTWPDTMTTYALREELTGFTALDDVFRRAEVCIGCHIGAAPDEKLGLPLRDAHHDIMASGHPRLSFEFGLFQTVLPPHWNDQRDKSPTFAAQTWAVGQAVTALKSLELLEYRAKLEDGPWPEFAEYNCYSCHHNLKEPSWQQKRGYAGRTPGALPWATWFTPMVRLLAARDDSGKPVVAALAEIDKLMTGPYPDRAAVAKSAHDAAESVRKWLPKLRDAGEFDKKACADLLAALAKTDPHAAAQSWDSAMQHTLAVSALHEAVKGNALASGTSAAIDDAIGELFKKLERGVFDSPAQYDLDECSRAFKKLQSRLAPVASDAAQ